MSELVGRTDAVSGLRARVRHWSERADALAVQRSAVPLRTLFGLLAVTFVLAALGLGTGLLLRDDPAAWFREGMPGTWLSAALLLAAAAAARAVYRREAGAPAWHASFWGLSAAILSVLFVVELTQPTVYAGHWLEDRAGAVAPFGITNVDAVLLIMLLATVFLLLARRALVLLQHPRALALFALTGALAVASQALDSFWPVSNWEFVAEESLKATAEPFLITAYLVALRGVLSRETGHPSGRQVP